MSAVGDIVFANSFSQPLRQLGTYFAPFNNNVFSPTPSIAYVAGVNKYVLYMAATATGVPFPLRFSVNNCPQSLVQTNTISASVTWIQKGSTAIAGTLPVFNYEVTSCDYTSGVVLTNNIHVSVENSVAAVYATGSAILKIVVNINFD